jgi:hypothetical protein
MAKHKNLLIAGSALLILAGALLFLPPSPSHSQGTTPDGFPVRIVNGGTTPVPTSVVGTATVAGTVQSQQSGNWSVALAPETKIGLDPANNTVKVSNAPATAVFTRGVDDSARQVFQAEATITMADGATTGMARFLFANNSQTVPAGKRLVIEDISARGSIPGGYGAAVHVLTRVDTRAARHFLVLNGQGYSPFGVDRVTSNQQVRVYADPGTNVDVVLALDSGIFGGLGTDILTATISGYLVDVP